MSLSARMIGEIIGMKSREVNLLLHEHGLLEGSPGNWSITEYGKSFGNTSYHDNGYGGYAAREWDYVMWDESVLDVIAQRNDSPWNCQECGQDLLEQDELVPYRVSCVCRKCYTLNRR